MGRRPLTPKEASQPKTGTARDGQILSGHDDLSARHASDADRDGYAGYPFHMGIADQGAPTLPLVGKISPMQGILIVLLLSQLWMLYRSNILPSNKQMAAAAQAEREACEARANLVEPI